jgi:HSP20 family protein
MTVVRWNPLREMLAASRVLDRMLDSDSGNWSTQDSGMRVAQLPIDAYSTDNEIVVTAAVPGLSPEDVEITVEGDALMIRGELPARLDNVKHLFAERYHGPFSRTLQLNVPIDVEKVEATFENGILTLTLPKAEEVRPKVIKVQTK